MADQPLAAAITWNESLATGIASLDEQHKALFECLNLLEAATQERSMIRTCYVLEQLSGYVQTHFADEERQMRLHDYPGLTGHIRQHRDFTNKLYQVRRAYLDRDITGDLVVLLRDWLLQHVSRADMDYVPYLTSDRCLLPMMRGAAAMATGNRALP